MPDLEASELAVEQLAEPAIVIDLSAPEIWAANAQARQLWGLASNSPMPIALENDMPALTNLPAGCEDTDSTQVFWTAHGAQRLRCTSRKLSNQTVLIVFEATAIPTPVKVDQDPQPHAVNSPIDLKTMAHELRTPMAAVIALAEMIESEQFGPLGDPRYREYARDIGDSARLSLGIVASALEHDTAQSVTLPGGFAEIDVSDIIEKCRRTVNQMANQADVVLSVETPDKLPRLIANAPALTQILLNLLTNAIKFTPAGGTVEMTANVSTNGTLCVCVSDTGVGMTELDTSVLVSIDSASQQPDTTAPMSETSARGIGFSLVHRLAAAMFADFKITSKRGIGTRATLAFPAAKTVPTTSHIGGN